MIHLDTVCRTDRGFIGNLSLPELYEHIVSREEGKITNGGTVGVRTKCRSNLRDYTYIVEEHTSASRIWWGRRYRPLDPVRFGALFATVEFYITTRHASVRDCYLGTDPLSRIPMRVVTEAAWHDLFARNIFAAAEKERQPHFTIIHLPNLHATSTEHWIEEPFTVVDLSRNVAVIVETDSPAAMRRSVISVANNFLPERQILPIYSSATLKKSRDETVLFIGATEGLDPLLNTQAISVNDDVHAWGRKGVSRLEAGRYCDIASPSEAEASALNPFLQRFGTPVENVPINRFTGEFEFRRLDNAAGGHATLPASSLENVEDPGCASHPSNIFIVVADEFGVLPPISKLTNDQTVYYYLSGPQTSSAPCFSPAGIPLPPKIYAEVRTFAEYSERNFEQFQDIDRSIREAGPRAV